MLVAKHSNSGTNLMDAEYKFEGNVSIICTYTILLRVLLSPIYTWWFRPFSRRGLIICIILYYMSHSDIIIYFVAWPFLLSLIHFSSVSIRNILWNSSAFEGNLFVPDICPPSPANIPFWRFTILPRSLVYRWQRTWQQ